MRHLIETDRLYFRELSIQDKNDLSKVLSDKESMKYYPHLFSEKEVEDWINWNIENYKKYGYGLWGVILKKDNKFIGDSGITVQKIDGYQFPEIGYHIIKNYNGNGYATEAAIACRKYAFEKLNIEKIYSYMPVENKPSRRVAEKTGMKLIRKSKKCIEDIEVEEMIYCLEKNELNF